MNWRGSRGRSLVALGFFLARRGVTAWVGLGLTVACVVGFGALAVVLARHGKTETLPDVPLVASSALAFGVGVLVAFAASTRAFRRDEDDGIRALLRARGVTTSGYLAGRLAGLAACLAALVSGGSFLVGVVALFAARGRLTALHTLQASVAAAIFGVAFALTFGPVAMATLGGRSRGGGYLALLSVLVVPELVAPALDRYVAHRWVEVCSIPGALAALRTSIAPVGVDPSMLGRALTALVVIMVTSLLIIRAELARAHGTADAPRSGHPPT